MSVRHSSTRLRQAFVGALSLTVLCAMSATAASAQARTEKTTVTFNAPVEIPGVGTPVLPAGTYVFALLDSAENRHIVQIFNQDGSHLFATILAVPNYRLKSTDKTVMTFAERPAGQPQAIRAWFYPGEVAGQEFVYPKTQAVALAAATDQPVLYMPDEAASNIVEPVTTPTDAPVVALKTVPLKAVQASGDDVDLADVVQPPPPQAEAARLPTSATNVPLVALIGLLCLGAGIAVRRSCAL